MRHPSNHVITLLPLPAHRERIQAIKSIRLIGPSSPHRLERLQLREREKMREGVERKQPRTGSALTKANLQAHLNNEPNQRISHLYPRLIVQWMLCVALGF